MPDWYYARNNQRLGPASMEQLKQLAASGQLSPNDLVWKEGMANWAAASTIPGLIGTAPPAPAAPRLSKTAPTQKNATDEVVDLPMGGPSFVELAKLIATRAVSPELDTMQVSAEEKTEFSKAGVASDAAQRYLVWRRSLLWVALVPLAIGTVALAIDALVNNLKPLNTFGVLVEIVRVLTMLALPAFAAIGALYWVKQQLSQMLVMLGVAICFGVPLLILLLPYGWLAEKDVAMLPANMIFSILVVLLSLAPGMVRGCLRVRSLLPESLLPGLVLFGAAPLAALVFYGVLLGVSNDLLKNLFALFLVLAPLSYVVGAKSYLRPITSPAERKAFLMWQWIAFSLSGAAALCAIVWVIHAVSKMDEGGFYLIWTAFAFFLDFLGRSLFVSVFAAQCVLWAIHTANPAGEKRLSELGPMVGKR